MCSELVRRLGVFLSFIVVALLFMFYLTTKSGKAENNLLYAGLLLGAFTYLILRATKPPPQESQRFRTLRRIMNRNDQKFEDQYEYEDEEEW